MEVLPETTKKRQYMYVCRCKVVERLGAGNFILQAVNDTLKLLLLIARPMIYYETEDGIGQRACIVFQ